jgi:hypothetical protein
LKKAQGTRCKAQENAGLLAEWAIGNKQRVNLVESLKLLMKIEVLSAPK